MRGPDALPPVSTIGEIESRMGLPTIESLLAERDMVVRDVATLRAMHGPFGTYEALRKIELARIGTVVRAKAVDAGTKITEAAIEEASHSHRDYFSFVTRATAEKAEWFVLENRIQGINDTINRGQAVARYLAAEVSLSR